MSLESEKLEDLLDKLLNKIQIGFNRDRMFYNIIFRSFHDPRLNHGGTTD